MVVLVDDMAGQPGLVTGSRVKKERGTRMARLSIQHVDSSPEFHQWIYLVFAYTMVCSKIHFENFDFWVWIKHPPLSRTSSDTSC